MDAQAPPTLYVCATPIGNLGDVSQRLRDVLAGVDVIACEDTRRTRALLSALAIPTPRLVSHRQDNERESVEGVLRMLDDGMRVALVSDAGTPGVMDPGVHLVRGAHERGVRVECIAGPSALAAAMSVSGMAARAWTFVGFLPRSQVELRQLIEQRAGDVIIGFEAPGRVIDTVDVIATEQPTRPVCIARELTKQHEQVVVLPAQELAHLLHGQGVRGEVVLVLAAMPGQASEAPPPNLVALVEDLVDAGVRLKDAARMVAAHLPDVRSGSLYDAVVDRRS